MSLSEYSYWSDSFETVKAGFQDQWLFQIAHLIFYQDKQLGY